MGLWGHTQLSYLPFSFQNGFSPKADGILIAMVNLKWKKAMPSKNLTWFLLCSFIFQQANLTFPLLTIPQLIQVLWICCSWEFGIHQRHKFTVAKGSKSQRAEGLSLFQGSLHQCQHSLTTFPFTQLRFEKYPVWRDFPLMTHMLVIRSNDSAGLTPSQMFSQDL